MIPVIDTVIAFVAVVFGIAVIIIYNALVVLRNNINAASADIDVLLKKRYDLIGSLIDVVRGYANYEKNILMRITSLRSSWGNVANSKLSDKMVASNQISSALKSVFAVSENYPDLKADLNFLNLQQQITEIEDQIADRREFYNNSVNSFNIMIQQIPYSFLAGLLRYQKVPFLQVPEGENAPVDAKRDG